DALLDDPGHEEAAGLLERVLIEGGDESVLADFLAQRFELARERRNLDQASELALRLGAIYERLGTGDPAATYREALALAPASRDLLRALVATFPEGDESLERIELCERLLQVESPERGAALAVELCSIWERLGDPERAFRALEQGHATSPGDVELRNRLEVSFREAGMMDRVAELLLEDADRAADPERAVEHLRGAAAIYRDQLADLPRAAEVLGFAVAQTPGDLPLVMEHASALASAGSVDEAIAGLGRFLDREVPDADRVEALLMRADLATTAGRDEAARGELAAAHRRGPRPAAGRDEEALEDLEAANRLDPGRAGELLRDALERRRERARARDDLFLERAASMRLARLLAEAGHEVHARDLLVHWLERSAGDEE